jgi:hypothetical protein
MIYLSNLQLENSNSRESSIPNLQQRIRKLFIDLKLKLLQRLKKMFNPMLKKQLVQRSLKLRNNLLSRLPVTLSLDTSKNNNSILTKDMKVVTKLIQRKVKLRNLLTPTSIMMRSEMREFMKAILREASRKRKKVLELHPAHLLRSCSRLRVLLQLLYLSQSIPSYLLIQVM